MPIAGQHPDGKIIAATCVPETPMIQKADITLLADAAQEDSVAQTRSFTSMVLLVQVLAALLVDDPSRMERLHQLPARLANMLTRAGDLPQKLGADLTIDRFFYLGSGPFYGIACEAMLKTKEMTTSWSESYHVLEFRHGPMSVVANTALVVGFISTSAADAEIQVLREMKAKGARTLAICEEKAGHDWNGVDDVVEMHSGLTDWERPVLCLPFIQWMAFARALAKGLDPDNPANLTQVVVLQ